MAIRRMFRSLIPSLSIIVVFLALIIAARAQTYNVLYTFTGQSDGSWPYAGLALDTQGNLYGTTAYGGQGCVIGCGTVFQLKKGSDGTWTETVVHYFTSGSDGSMPEGDLITDEKGNVYGTAAWGGIAGWMGVAFQLAPNGDGTWTYNVLHSFGGGDGTGPIGGLVFDEAGNLFGTTWLGGTLNACNNGCGTVFKLSPNAQGGWDESVIFSFGGGSDGSEPYDAVTLDSAGNVFGTTSIGGDLTACNFGCGTIFQLKPSPSGAYTKTTVHTFHNNPASTPFGGLSFDSAGSLYGTSTGGGSGMIYAVTRRAASPKFRIVHTFTGGADGASPQYGKLVSDAYGNLYGVTQLDGTAGAGTVYKLTPGSNGSWDKRVLYNFTGGSDGGYPMSGVIIDKSGNLFGATYAGGSGAGVVFEITP